MWDVLLEEEDPAQRKPPSAGAASSSEAEEAWSARKYDILKPAKFVGSISDILKKFPEWLQILRVGVSLVTCTHVHTHFVYFTFLSQ